jgi:transposase
VLVSHPRTNAWIAKDPNKCDRVDAFKLADLLRMNRVHEVYYPESQARQTFKQVVQHFDDLTGQQARLKVKIKARLRAQGVICRGKQVFTVKGREQALVQVIKPEMRLALTQLYAVLDQTRQSQREAQRLMVRTAKEFPEVALFQQVPGIGIIGACRFSAYVQTPHRFSSKRKLWRYCRPGVSERRSDGKRLGGVSLDRAGCGALKNVSRKAFEIARRRPQSNAIKRAYEQALERTHNAVHARLCVQRKIIAILRAMWISGQPYCDEMG